MDREGEEIDINQFSNLIKNNPYVGNLFNVWKKVEQDKKKEIEIDDGNDKLLQCPFCDIQRCDINHNITNAHKGKKNLLKKIKEVDRNGDKLMKLTEKLEKEVKEIGDIKDSKWKQIMKYNKFKEYFDKLPKK